MCGDCPCQENDVFSFWQNDVSDGADWTSTGRLFQSRGPAAANERSPTVTSRDGRTSRRLEVDERSRPQRLDDRSTTYCSWQDKYWGAVPWRARYTMTAPVWNWCAQVLKSVETGDSVCNMLRAMEASDQPSCRVQDGLETVKQQGRKATLLWLASCEETVHHDGYCCVYCFQ